MELTNSVIIEENAVKMRNPMLLIGLPGVGFVSKLTVEHLIKELQGKKFATLYSSTFPNQVLALKKGLLKMLSMTFYHCRVKSQDLILMKGDVQPLTVEGQYEVANTVLNFFQKLGGKTVISMAGYAVNQQLKKRKIYCTSTSKQLLLQMQKLGTVKQEHTIPIVGLAGLVPGLSKLHDAKGCCLLIETSGEPIDSAASEHLIELFEKMLDFKVNRTNLHDKAKKMSEKIRKLNERVAQEQMALQHHEAEIPEALPPVPEAKDLGYIR